MNRDEYRASPLAPVRYEADGERWTLVFARDLAQRPEVVWAALTEADQLGQWSPFGASRDLTTIGPVTLTIYDGDRADEDIAAEVLTVDPPRFLEYTWGQDLVRWELSAAGSGTHLELRHTVADRDWLSKVAAGWHMCLDVAAYLLDGDPIGPIRGSEAIRYGWTELNEAYSDRLGIESTSQVDRHSG
jgi:uncharacterized protein YndB with AHSA1/START domain